MESKILFIVFHIFFSLEFCCSKSQTWIKAGYHWNGNVNLPVSSINSALYTHLICAFAGVNSTNYQVSFSSPSDERVCQSFTDTVKQKNPPVTTLLSIGGTSMNTSTFSSLVSNDSHRKSFIESSIRLARLYGFQGLDLYIFPDEKDMLNMGILFREWRAATIIEARKYSQSQLILTNIVQYSPQQSYPISSAQRYLNWVHVLTTAYKFPTVESFTGAHAALFDPIGGGANTDEGIKAWINAGFSSNKLVICLPFYGYAWTLVDPKVNGVGAPAAGPANSKDGFMIYKEIKSYIKLNGAKVAYNATYVVSYCSIGNVWLCFDDVDVVRVKISYSKEKKLLGYFVWEVLYDDNWELSQAAADEGDKINASSNTQEDKKIGRNINLRILVITLTTTVLKRRI